MGLLDGLIPAITTGPTTFGYWGKPTSTVDWCEINYQLTHYVAEFFNTMSSFSMVLVGLAGAWLHYKRFERRYALAFLSIAIVGFGSVAFHGTLLFSLQMLDELPMIYTSLILAYCIIQQPHLKRMYSPWLELGMILHGVITTALVASPAFAPEYASPTLQFMCFHVSFAMLEIFLLYKAFRLYQREENSQFKQMHLVGAGLWGAGLLCWIVDYAGCKYLWEGEHSLRARYFTWTVQVPVFHVAQGAWHWYATTLSLPNPQLHSWWHVFASSGLYMMTLAVAQNRAKVLGKKVSLAYIWYVVPYIQTVDGPVFPPRSKSSRSATAPGRRSSEVEALEADAAGMGNMRTLLKRHPGKGKQQKRRESRESLASSLPRLDGSQARLNGKKSRKSER